ncbi:MAG: hypothetical protein IT440_02205 [Phycisphaeraceae bacterium]|nr:hypothetical protein [Phycisphaeraceae bacterium]
MPRNVFLALAEAGLAAPIATDLLMPEHAHVEAVKLDGAALGQVVIAAAHRFRSPMALPLMDLAVEKQAIMMALGVAEDQIETGHLPQAPTPRMIEQIEQSLRQKLTPRMMSTCQAIRHVVTHSDLLPMGMCIGPFSLVAKLMADPITAVFLAGMGMTAEDEPEVAMLLGAIELSTRVIRRYIEAQMDAGATAVIVCEPAANMMYFSPNQMAGPGDIFDQIVMQPMRRLIAPMEARQVSLVLHDCGEMTTDLIGRLASLRPSMLSLGSPVKLWEAASNVPKDVVLYGNLPSKRFAQRDLMLPDEVERDARALQEKMKQTGHPFILGTECDVLAVPGVVDAILRKVDALVNCSTYRPGDVTCRTRKLA